MKSAIKCDHCELKYSRRQSMVRHLKRVHKDIKPQKRTIVKRKNVNATKKTHKNSDQIQTIPKTKSNAKKSRTTKNSNGTRCIQQSIQIYKKVNATNKRRPEILLETPESITEASNEEIIPAITDENTTEPMVNEAVTSPPEGGENVAVTPAQPSRIFTPEEISTIRDEIFVHIQGIDCKFERRIVANKMLFKYLQHDIEKINFLKRLNEALEQVKLMP